MTDLEDKKRLTEVVARLLAEQFRAVSAELGLPVRAEDLPPWPPRNTDAWRLFWREQDKIMRRELTPVLRSMADGKMSELMLLTKTSVWTELVDTAIAKAQAAILLWADSYTFGLVKGINETSRNVIEDALRKALTLPGFTRENLVAELAPTFGANRAEMIGVTEVTRAYSEGQQLGAQELKEVGIVAVAVWHVNEGSTTREPDECDDRDELPESEWPTDEFPPLHPNCECTVTYDIRGPA